MAERALATAFVNIVPGTKELESYLKGGLGASASGSGAMASQSFASGFGSKLKSFIGPVMATAATYGAVSFVKSSLEAAESALVADKRLTQVAESMNVFGAGTGVVVERLQDYASAMSRNIAVDDESIKLTQAKLFTFKELAATAGTVGGAFDRATTAAYDMAKAGFGSAEMNAVQLGKALNDPIKGITALSRSGITFTEVEKARIKTLVESNKIGEAQSMILEAIETQVGGTAAATATAADKMKISWSELQETVGNALAPAFGALALALVPVIDTLAPALASVIGALAPVLLTVANILPSLLTALMPLAPVITDVVLILGEMLEIILPPLVELISALSPILSELAPIFTSLLKSVLPLLPVVVMLVQAFMPLIMAILPPLIDLLVALMPILVGVAEIIAGVLGAAIGLLTGDFKAFLDFLPKIGEGFKKVWEGIVGVAKTVFNSIIGFVEGFINRIINGINGIIGAINTVLAAGSVIGISLKISKISPIKLPRLAEGGYVDQATTAIIGEAGPEVVTPLKDFERMLGLDDNGNGKTINYYAAPNQSIDSEQALFKAIRRAKVVAQW